MGVFDDVVCGVGEAMDFGGGETGGPLVEKFGGETEIAFAPEDGHRTVTELEEIGFDFF